MQESIIEPFRIFEIDHGTGGRIALCRLPGRSGQMDIDSADIARWAPTIVLSLTERDEAATFGASTLGNVLTRHGIRHLWFPIRDFGTPDADDLHWPILTAELHDTLDQGGSLLLHCLGGKGRSGMVAMRLLVERGLAPATALERVRAAREGAVETREQESWANGNV